jgi:hypothetical protein
VHSFFLVLPLTFTVSSVSSAGIGMEICSSWFEPVLDLRLHTHIYVYDSNVFSQLKTTSKHNKWTKNRNNTSSIQPIQSLHLCPSSYLDSPSYCYWEGSTQNTEVKFLIKCKNMN